MKENMLLAHFSSKELQALIHLQGGESRDKATGLLEFSSLGELADNNTFAQELRIITNKLKQSPKLAQESLALSDTETTKKRKTPTIAKKIAQQGRRHDTELALIPISLAKALIYAWHDGKPKLNPETRLLEFGTGHDVAAGALNLLTAGLGFAAAKQRTKKDPYGHVEAARIHADAAAKREAQAREDAENLLKKMGYYEEVLIDDRPSRPAHNPYYNSRTARAGVPAYIGKEYYDPKTDERLDYDEAWIRSAERKKEQPKTNLLLAQEYVLSPKESDAKMRRESLPLIEADKTLNKIIRYGLDARSFPEQKTPSKLSTLLLRRSLVPSKSPKISETKKLESFLVKRKNKETKSPGRDKSILRAVSQSDGYESAYKNGGLISPTVSCGIKGKGTGQSDDIKVDMPVGSYIIDATTTAHLGDGSSTAGIKALDSMVKAISKSPVRRLIERRIQVKKIPVAVANEEYKIAPVDVAIIGNGDIGKGSKLLERMVKRVRQHKAQGGLNLPPQALPPIQYLKG